MEEPPPRERALGHPIDWLALVLAAAAAAAAYAFLFRRTEVPRAVDPLLGTVLVVEFVADQPWKRGFPAAGETVLLDEYLLADLLEPEPAGEERPGFRRVRLRVRGRESQQAQALTEFRWGVWRGSTVSLRSRGEGKELISIVSAEVLSVAPPAGR